MSDNFNPHNDNEVHEGFLKVLDKIKDQNYYRRIIITKTPAAVFINDFNGKEYPIYQPSRIFLYSDLNSLEKIDIFLKNRKHRIFNNGLQVNVLNSDLTFFYFKSYRKNEREFFVSFAACDEKSKIYCLF